MTWVKICGMTNLEDALVAVDAGADAVGFVFFEKSPRNVSVEVVREIVEKLPEGVEKVGVFVNASADYWAQIVSAAKLDSVQHYMPLDPDVSSHQRKAADRTVFPVLPNFYLGLALSLLIDAGAIQDLAKDFERVGDELGRNGLDAWILDSGSAGLPGGTGKKFDWAKATPIALEIKKCGQKAVIAGGLNSENVKEAIHILNPWGVDVVSGVEAWPGKKDPEKVRAFVRAVREADRVHGLGS
jgi:phosphoribosylanthranilate isomerase